MQFLFRAWPPLKTIGDPQQLAEAASCIADSIRDSGAFSSDGTAIRFEVIDIRRGYYNQKQVNRLLDRLHGLLLVRPEQLRHVSGASRFLFIGSASALAVPEDEWDRKRSIKRDAELAIRTLQNYGVAHYGHIGESGAEVGPDHSLARSAVIGLARHYRNRSPTGTANTLQRIALDLESLVRSARRLPEFAHLGSLDATSGHGAEGPDLGRLLREMALLYQLGKGDRPRAFDPVARLEQLRRTGGLTFGGDTPHSSYGLFVDLLADLGEWAEVYPLAVSAGKSPEKTSARSKRSRHAQSIAEMSFKLARYDLLRDFGRVLGKGALRRLGEQAREPRILIIDDGFFRILAAQTADASRRRLIKGLSLAFGVAWDRASVHVVPSNFVDARTDLLSSDHIANLLSDGAAREAVDLNGRPVEASVDLHDYLAVLIDPEARADGLGPIRVQRLASHVRRGASRARRHGTAGPCRPARASANCLLPKGEFRLRPAVPEHGCRGLRREASPLSPPLRPGARAAR